MGQELRPHEELRSGRKAGKDTRLGRPVGTYSRHVGRPAQALHPSAAYVQSVRMIVINLIAECQQRSSMNAWHSGPYSPVAHGVTPSALPLEETAVRPLSSLTPSRIIKGHAGPEPWRLIIYMYGRNQRKKSSRIR